MRSLWCRSIAWFRCSAMWPSPETAGVTRESRSWLRSSGHACRSPPCLVLRMGSGAFARDPDRSRPVGQTGAVAGNPGEPVLIAPDRVFLSLPNTLLRGGRRHDRIRGKPAGRRPQKEQRGARCQARAVRLTHHPGNAAARHTRSTHLGAWRSARARSGRVVTAKRSRPRVAAGQQKGWSAPTTRRRVEPRWADCGSGRLQPCVLEAQAEWALIEAAPR